MMLKKEQKHNYKLNIKNYKLRYRSPIGLSSDSHRTSEAFRIVNSR